MPSAKNLKIAIIAAKYNVELVKMLLGETQKTLEKAGAKSIRLFRVPGSYDIPVLAMALARSKKYDAIIALGVIIAGKTSHAEHIAMASAINLQKAAMDTGVPIIHQILTPKNVRDARARVRIRGVEAAKVAIEMGLAMRQI